MNQLFVPLGKRKKEEENEQNEKFDKPLSAGGWYLFDASYSVLLSV